MNATCKDSVTMAEGQPTEAPSIATPPAGGKKRNRTQLSCSACRSGKLKCDRGQPCDQCVRRDRTSLCIYARPLPRKKPPQNLRSRLNNLEDFVIGMMEKPSAMSWPLDTPLGDGVDLDRHLGTPQSIDADGSEACELQTVKSVQAIPRNKAAAGQIIIGKTEMTYVGATHWAAILDDIDTLKSYFNDQEEEDQADEDAECPDVTFGSPLRMTKAGLLAAFPGRNVVDMLVYQYFNSNDPLIHILHKPTFQNEYKTFWEDPSQTPVCWYGLLYSIMCLGTYVMLRTGEQPAEAVAEALKNINKYRTLCSQCIILSDYTKPGLYTLVALMFYSATEFIRSSVTKFSIWLLSGMVVRIALRLGYHRNPDNQPAISVFQGEMRRRIWHALVQFDLLFSFQLGLPSMVRSIQSDTGYPHNLLDIDFLEDSVQLPPSRAESEPTAMSYMINKSRVCFVFGEVVEQANLTSPPSYTEVLDLDARLNNAYAAVPQILQVRSIGQSLIDPPELLMERFNIALIYQKSRCVLHRKYLVEDITESRYDYSRATCLHAAMELLKYQSQIDQAIQPGGQLSRDKWYASSLAMHDFLLAAMIISIHLRHISHDTDGKQGNDGDYQNLMAALKTSWDIWKGDSNSKDAMKAENVLDSLVRMAEQRALPERMGEVSGTHVPCWSADNIADGHGKNSSLEDQQLLTNRVGWAQRKATNKIHHSSSIAGVDNTAQINSSSNTALESVQDMIDTPETLNWATWDVQVNVDDLSTLDQTLLPQIPFYDLEFLGLPPGSENAHN